MKGISALNHNVLFSQFPPSLSSFSHSPVWHFYSTSHPHSRSFLYLSPWKIPLIFGSGFEQKLWAKRLILALIPLVWTIIKVLNWFLGGYVFFNAGSSQVQVTAWNLFISFFILCLFFIFILPDQGNNIFLKKDHTLKLALNGILRAGWKCIPCTSWTFSMCFAPSQGQEEKQIVQMLSL